MSPASSNSSNTAFSFSTSSRIARLRAPHRLIVDHGQRSEAAWFTPTMERLKALLALPVGWDGYNAPPVRVETAYFALDMLNAVCKPDTPAPQIVPGSFGDLQVEWHTNEGDIELHVRSPNSVAAWRETADDENGEEINLTNDFVVVLNWLQEMREDASAASAAAA